MHLFLYALVPKKEKLHWNSYTNFIPEVININFPFDIWQIWQILFLKWRVPGGWAWNLASVWHKLWEYSICEWPLTQVHQHLQSWNIWCLKSRVLRHYKVALLLIAQGEIQSIEQEMLSAKAKSDRAIQNFD